MNSIPESCHLLSSCAHTFPSSMALRPSRGVCKVHLHKRVTLYQLSKVITEGGHQHTFPEICDEIAIMKQGLQAW